ncbi:hypothetical protein SBADM41S_00316 [Streptomyces badius]
MPVQCGRAPSSGSSLGPPVRTFADTSLRSSRMTAVAASSLPLAGRESWERPGTAWSTIASRPSRSSSGSVTVTAVPCTTTER